MILSQIKTIFRGANMLCKWISKNIGNELYLGFRLIIGAMFFMHGAQKFGLFGLEGSISGMAAGIGVPVWLAGLSAFIELAGGVLIVLGLFTRAAAFFGALNMIAAWLIAHIPKGWNPMANGGELALMYFASFLALVALGARKYSLETALFKKEHT